VADPMNLDTATIEAAARALLAQHDGCEMEDLEPEQQGWWRRDAKAALESAIPLITPLIAARELRDAADRMPAFHDRDVHEWAIVSACKWLKARADALAPQPEEG
jgi:hypothetical protein